MATELEAADSVMEVAPFPAIEREAGDREAGDRGPHYVVPVDEAVAAIDGKRQEDRLTFKDPWQLGYDWPVVIWIAVVHLGALGRAVFLHLEGPGLCAFLCWLTGSIGVCMGYHRQLTHGSFCHLSADALAAGLAWAACRARARR